MFSNFLNQEPKLLVSDSLKESFLEESEQKSFDSFITAAFVTIPKSNSLIGSLVGVEFAENPKFDIKASLYDAFSFITNVLTSSNNQKVQMVILSLGEKDTNLMGPFQISNAKIVEINPINKTCVLAIDLIRIAA
jgi:hypothetical protein